MPYNWEWVAVYPDGNQLFEDTLRAEGKGFRDIPHDDMSALMLVPRDGSSAATFVVRLVEGMRPIFFRRVRQLQLNDPASPIPDYYVQPDGTLTYQHTLATVLGWQKTVNGRNVKSLTWLFADGSVAVTDRDIDHLDVVTPLM